MFLLYCLRIVFVSYANASVASKIIIINNELANPVLKIFRVIINSFFIIKMIVQID